MTEDEIKKKQCPKLATAAMMLGIEMGKNSSSEEDITTAMTKAVMCVGSECAMWEDWEHQQGRIVHGGADIPEGWVLDEDADLGVSTSKRITRQTRVGEGDCGLKTKELECNGN